MIAKCFIIILLAVIATAFPLGCEQPTVVLPGCGSCSNNGLTTLVSGVSGIATSGTIAKNVVANGKYPVALSSCGPNPAQQIPVTSSHITAPCQEKPTVRLSCNIPAPRTISHSCTCYKTIVRPRVHQQVVTVPTVQRYIESSLKPVVESIQYEAVPVNCGGGSGVQMVPVSSGMCSTPVQTTPTIEAVSAVPVQTVQAVSAVSVPVVQVPQFQTVEAPKCQTIEVPQFQTVEAPKCQTIEVQQFQSVEVPKCQTVQVPQFQAIEVPKCQTIEVPQFQAVEVPKCQTVQLPQFQTVQIPQTISFGSSVCNTC